MTDTGFEAARLTVRLGALTANYAEIGRLAPGAAVAPVVKADAYGTGLAPVATALAGAGADSFFVARVEEGEALRTLLPKARIFVLDGLAPDSVPRYLGRALVPVLNTMDQLALWRETARNERTTLSAVVHIDTGMNRLGFDTTDFNLLAVDAPALFKGLDLALVMSHLACADAPDHPMNARQLARFRAVLARLPSAPASLAASGGVILGRDYHFDLVRPGIALYGGNPQAERLNPFKTAVVFTGRILQIRRVDKGESVGYGATFHTERPAILATVALGYADGLMRAISNQGAAAIAGVRAPVVGRVSMDLVVLDVSAVPPSALGIGAEAEFFGDTIALEEFAANTGTVNYEALTSVGARVPRVYVEGSSR